MSPEEIFHEVKSPYPEFGLTEREAEIFESQEDGDETPVGYISPGEAQERLEKMGYERTLWQDLVASSSVGSHELVMTAIVALGDEPRLSYVIIANLRALDYLEDNPRLRSDIGIIPTLDYTPMHTEALKAAILKKQS